MVVVHRYGPIVTRGWLEVSGRMAMLGRTRPREVASVELEEPVEIVDELESGPEEACLAVIWEEEENLDAEKEEVGAAAEVNGLRVAELKDPVEVEEDTVFGTVVDIAAGQKLQTCLF